MIQYYHNGVGWCLHHRLSNTFLLQLRDNNPKITEKNCWVFPGGTPEPGEYARQTAVRELWEELQYRPKVMQEILTMYFPKKHVADHYYYVPLPDNTEKLVGREGAAWGYFTLQQMESLKLGYYTRELIPVLRRWLKENT